MGELFFGAALFAGVLLVFGVGYPLVMLLLYPVYRWLGGRKRLRAYMKDL